MFWIKVAKCYVEKYLKLSLYLFGKFHYIRCIWNNTMALRWLAQVVQEMFSFQIFRNSGKRWKLIGLSDSNGIRTHNHLVRKRTLNHSAKLARLFVYELSGCWFEFRCCHLNLRYRACFEQKVPWHLGNYIV